MGFQDLIVIAVAVVALGVVARFIWRSIAGKTACGCGHNKTPGSNACGAAPRTGIKQTPLVGLQTPNRHEDK